jgi:hypothetical protein
MVSGSGGTLKYDAFEAESGRFLGQYFVAGMSVLKSNRCHDLKLGEQTGECIRNIQSATNIHLRCLRTCPSLAISSPLYAMFKVKSALVEGISSRAL